MFSQQESDMLWAIVMLCLRASTLQGGKYVISLLLINDMTPNQLVVVSTDYGHPMKAKSINTVDRLQECRQLSPLSIHEWLKLITFLQPVQNVNGLLIKGSSQ